MRIPAARNKRGAQVLLGWSRNTLKYQWHVLNILDFPRRIKYTFAATQRGVADQIIIIIIIQEKFSRASLFLHMLSIFYFTKSGQTLPKITALRAFLEFLFTHNHMTIVHALTWIHQRTIHVRPNRYISIGTKSCSIWPAGRYTRAYNEDADSRNALV